MWKLANLPSVGCTDSEITKRRVIERERPANKAVDAAAQPTPTSGWSINLSQILLRVLQLSLASFSVFHVFVSKTSSFSRRSRAEAGVTD